MVPFVVSELRITVIRNVGRGKWEQGGREYEIRPRESGEHYDGDLCCYVRILFPTRLTTTRGAHRLQMPYKFIVEC